MKGTRDFRTLPLLIVLLLAAPPFLALSPVSAQSGSGDPATTPATSVDPAWWSPEWHFRVPVTVTAALPATGKDLPQDFALDLVRYPVEVEVDFRPLLVAAGFARGTSLRGFTLDADSIRVIGPDAQGAIRELPSAFYPGWLDRRNDAYDPVLNPHGTVSWIVEGPVKAGETLTFYLYFDSLENGKKPVAGYRTQDAFGLPTRDAVTMGHLDSLYWTSPGTLLYGYAAEGTSLNQAVEILGLHRNTTVQVFGYSDGVPNTVPRETLKVDYGTVRVVSVPAGPVKVVANKPIVAGNRLGAGGTVYYPSTSGGPLGSDFLITARARSPVDNALVTAPFQAATVTVSTLGPNNVPQPESQVSVPLRGSQLVTLPEKGPVVVNATDSAGRPVPVLLRNRGDNGAILPSMTGAGLGLSLHTYTTSGAILQLGALAPATLEVFSKGRTIDTVKLAGKNVTERPYYLFAGQGAFQGGDALFVTKDGPFWAYDSLKDHALGALGGRAGRTFDFLVESRFKAVLIPFSGDTDVVAVRGDGARLEFPGLNPGSVTELGPGRYSLTATKPVTIILTGTQFTDYGMLFSGRLPSPKTTLGPLQWGGRLVELTTPRPLEFVEAGQTLKVPVTVTNKGRTISGANLPDSVTLELLTENGLPEGWKVNLVPLQVNDLGTGESRRLELLVEVPADAKAGNVTELTLVATSNANPLAGDRLTVGFEPRSQFDVSLRFDDDSALQFQPLDAEGRATFTLIVANTGNVPDTVSVNLPSILDGWKVNLSAPDRGLSTEQPRSSLRIPLAPGAFEVLKLTTKAPPGNTGFLPLYVTAKSSGSPTQRQVLAVSVVAADSDVALEGPATLSALPGEVAEYNLTLRNKGGPTTVVLSTAGSLPPGWVARLLTKPLGSDRFTEEMTVNLAAKDDPQGADRVAVKLLVTPAASASAFISIPLEVVAKPPVQGSRGEARFLATTVVAARHDLSATLGEDGRTLRLVNRGNGPESFRFALGAAPEGWTVTLPDAVAALPRDGNITRTLLVTPAASALAGQHEVRLVAVFEDGERLTVPITITLGEAARLTLNLSTTSLATYPGGLAEVRGSLRSTGTVPAVATLRLEGNPRLIASFTPERVTLQPGEAVPLAVVLRVPLTEVPGNVPLVVRAEAPTGELLARTDLRLTVETVDLRFDGDPFVMASLDGETRRVEARIINAGKVPVQNVTVTAFEEVQGVWVAVSNVTFETVPPATGSVDARPRLAALEWVSTPGATRVKVEIDPHHTVPDSDRVNSAAVANVPGNGTPGVPFLWGLLAVLGLAAVGAHRKRCRP
ncbi:MAG TPA: NEW3 domain-containing protein [Candidatus Thermoplasmatota archaeon]|nr:NEW3 domain-containing protein [Candidatus Thermoplasmatota archaeon]